MTPVLIVSVKMIHTAHQKYKWRRRMNILDGYPLDQKRKKSMLH